MSTRLRRASLVPAGHLPSVCFTRAGRTADRTWHEPDRGRPGGNGNMAIRADAASSAVARPHDTSPQMGAAALRLDPAKARQRPLPEPPPLTEHGPARV